MIQVFVLNENMLANAREGKMKKKSKMENIILSWFFLRWFQHDISMVLKVKEVSCFTHKPIRVWFN